MTYTTFTRVDNRQRPQCGARAGHCDHMQADPYRVQISVSMDRAGNKSRRPLQWNQRERELMRSARDHGYTFQQTADVMNTSRNAVAGVLQRMEGGRP